MDYRRKLRIGAFASSILLFIIIAYYYSFIVLIRPLVSNITIVVIVITFIGILVMSSIFIKRVQDTFYIIPQTLIFIFFSRALPNIRLSNPPLHDPYYHFICAQNVIDYGTLDPIYSNWYPQVGFQLHWPLMHILSASLVNVLSIQPLTVFTYQGPFLGICLFFGVYIFAYSLSKKFSIAMLSAMIASISDILIFYQSEYHPQGYAIVVFVFFLFLYQKRSTIIRRSPLNALMIILGISIALSHHFTSLFIGFFALSIFLILIFLDRYIKPANQKNNRGIGIIFNESIWLIIALIMITYHIVIYYVFVSDALTLMAIGNTAVQAASTGPAIPLYQTILNSMKWFILLSCLIFLLYVIKKRMYNELKYGIMICILLLVGLIGVFWAFLPTDRIIGLYLIVASVFSASTIIFFTLNWKKQIKASIKGIGVGGILTLVLVASFFNSQSPAYFFHNSPTNPYYWYSNDLSSISRYDTTGAFVSEYTPGDSIFLTEFDTLVIPFYYGNHSTYNVYRYQGTTVPVDSYALFNEQITISDEYDKGVIINDHNRIYSDGRMVVIIGK